MKLLKYSTLVHKNVIDTYAEFLFACCLAVECNRRGYALDMEGAGITCADSIGDYTMFAQKLMTAGAMVFDVSAVKDSEVSELKLDGNEAALDGFNIQMITDLGYKLFRYDKENREYDWSIQWVDAVYGDYVNTFTNTVQAGTALIYLFAYLIVEFALKPMKKHKVVFNIPDMYVYDNRSYIDLYAIITSNKWLNSFVKMNINIKAVSDLDIGLLLQEKKAIHAGTFKLCSVYDKLKELELTGLESGSIGILYTRKGMSNANPLGVISGASVVRIDNIDSYNFTITGRKYSAYKTYLERLDDYYEIPEEDRYMYADLIDKEISSDSSFSIPLVSTGVETCFYNENYLLCKVDPTESVRKKVMTKKGIEEIEMTGVEAVYWILSEVNVDFDKELYRVMYNKGKSMLFDTKGVKAQDFKLNN